MCNRYFRSSDILWFFQLIDSPRDSGDERDAEIVKRLTAAENNKMAETTEKDSDQEFVQSLVSHIIV